MKSFSTLIFINAIGLANGRMYDVAMPYLDPVNCAKCVNWEDSFAQNYFANASLVESFSNYCAHLGNAPGMYSNALDPQGWGAESAFCMCDEATMTPCESNVTKMSTYTVFDERSPPNSTHTQTQHTHTQFLSKSTSNSLLPIPWSCRS